MTSAALPTKTVSVLIVDDEPDLRLLLRTMLAIDGRFKIAGEAADGDAGLAMCRELSPDVVLLDQRMPLLEGLEVAKLVLDERPDQKVILMSAFLNEAIIRQAAELGIQSVIGKQDLDNVIEEILRLVN